MTKTILTLFLGLLVGYGVHVHNYSDLRDRHEALRDQYNEARGVESAIRSELVAARRLCERDQTQRGCEDIAELRPGFPVPSADAKALLRRAATSAPHAHTAATKE